ncbi:MAG: DNA polymerase III subunit gamma/tau [Candidatus Eremiobacteraeota bacterium]|nr:DNA polymerase III subunit gamma/tau [Candidatus Eremiobacteraeota bacterium]
MSLYRTWRPLTFSDLVGQDAVVRTLTAAIESGKIAHAYLFSGPRGSGKTSAAKILARCINCENGPTPRPDNTCENCRAMLAGAALDVLEIDAASNRGIDEIRALREAVKFAPASMRMKIYIIDEAHMLTKEGANAFLKTLEEPPPHAVFILATTEPERLPVTILSRCQRYAFRRIAVPVMIEKMKEIAKAEKIAIDDDALAAIAYRADGGLRDALTMLEQLAAYSGDARATAATLDLAFGATGRQFAEALVEAAAARDATAALRVVEEAGDAGTDLSVLMRSLIAAFRNLLVARIDPELLARDLAPEDAARVVRQAESLTQPAILRALRTFGEASALARAGGNARLELETALLRFIMTAEDSSLDALSTRIAVLEERLGSNRAVPAAAAPTAATPAPAAPAPAAAPQAPAAAAPAAPDPSQAEPPKRRGDVSLQKVRAAWQSIRGKVEGERQSLSAPLSRAAIDSVESNAVVLKLPNTWSAETLRDHAALIEKAIADVLGVPLKLRLKVDGSTPRPAAQEESTDALFDYANERIR